MICVDASVAAQWILDDVRSTEALALARAVLARGEEVIAPTLLPYEVTNAVRQRIRRGAFDQAEAAQRLAAFLGYPISLRSVPQVHERALALADIFDLHASYDAHYVALAEILGCDLWTDDQRLLGSVTRALPFVRWIGDHPVP